MVSNATERKHRGAHSSYDNKKKKKKKKKNQTQINVPEGMKSD